ncbi:hypothetical protein [Sodalis-like endosymbiont of Proechinophthirus fluctus]|uniref:hypothetical protein n=1 Tax=Sodalis-like endosymbiont of Proechinophthirus fluctus TaxID=1462730 RepID=UPI00164F5F87|nr:hypothetical protein [Sodalis-like endosymbiont of Proechinophthirus fluctus]
MRSSGATTTDRRPPVSPNGAGLLEWRRMARLRNSSFLPQRQRVRMWKAWSSPWKVGDDILAGLISAGGGL